MSKAPKAEPKTEDGVDHPASPEELLKALDFPSINEPPGPRVPVPTMHTLTSLDPAEAAIGDADVTLHVIGTGFTEGAQIVFNGGLETTVFVSDTEVTTIVKPSTAGTPGTYPVTVVQNGFTVEPPLEFTFTEAEAASRSKRKRY